MKKKFFLFVLSIAFFSCSSPSHLEKQAVAKPALSDSSYSKWTVYYLEQLNLYNGNVSKPDSGYPKAAQIGYQKSSEIWQDKMNAAKQEQDRLAAQQARSVERESKLNMKKNFLAISPFGLVQGKYAKARLRFQHSTKTSAAWGTDLKIFYGSYAPGWEVCPFIKLFTDKTAKEFYFYATAFYGKHTNYPDDYSKYYDFSGAGGGIGWQIRQTVILDLSFGLKYIHTDANLRLAREKEYDGYFPSVQSVFCGSKSVFDGIFAIGFRF